MERNCQGTLCYRVTLFPEWVCNLNSVWVYRHIHTRIHIHGEAPVFLPGEFNGRGAWWATVHGITKCQKRVSTEYTHTHTHTSTHFCAQVYKTDHDNYHRVSLWNQCLSSPKLNLNPQRNGLGVRPLWGD